MESIDDVLKKVRRDFVRTEDSKAYPAENQRDAYIGDPDCPLCHGIGYISQDLPVGDPKFGRMTVCPCRQKEIETAGKNALMAESNLNGYQQMTFENFNIEGRGQLRADQRFCLKLARDHALKFSREHSGWLFLTGNYGTGKTHLAAAIANSALQEGISNIFQPVPDLLDWLRASYGSTSESYESRFEQIRNTPLLILDDLGTQSSTPWAEEKLYQIMNYRYVHQLPTVITSNVSMHDLDGRIASRLEDPSLVTHIVLQAPDYRSPLAGAAGTDELSILHLLNDRTFDTFDSRKGENLSEQASSELLRAFNESFNFAQNPRGWLVLAGPSGIGKTHLAAAIGNYRKAQMDTPLFVTASDLLDHLRATFSPSSPTTYDVMFEQVRNTQLLILNYLDTMNATPWAKEKMYQILNYRYQAQLPTVITLMKPIQEVDPNIRSRLVDAKFCMVVQMFQVPMYSKNPDVDLSLPPRSRKGVSLGKKGKI